MTWERRPPRKNPIRAMPNEPVLNNRGEVQAYDPYAWATQDYEGDTPETKRARLLLAKSLVTGDPDDIEVASDACLEAGWETAADILRIRARNVTTRRRLAAVKASKEGDSRG